MASTKAVVSKAPSAVVPYLVVKDAEAAIEFYKRAFDAVEIMRLNGPGTRIGHAELRIGGAVIMLSDEFPDFGSLSAQTLGGSPVKIHLSVGDVDAVAQRAVAAGAKVLRPVADQFYGQRSGQLGDPFGYVWIVSTHQEDVSAEEMQRRMDAMTGGATAAETAKPTRWASPTAYIRAGFHTVTPYLIVPGAAKLMDFMKEALSATEMFRIARPGSDLIMHAEAKVGDSMVEMADANDEFPPTPAALHLYVPDVDRVYARAMDAGATSLAAVADQEYDERSGGVKDVSGNYWYIATAKGASYVPKGHHSITPYLHPLRAPQVIDFMQKAFGAVEMFRAQSPDGVVHHAEVRIGDSLISMGEAQGPYQPMPCTLHLYVPDAEAMYESALRAGATTIMPVKEQPYGDLSGGVKDPFGNRWFLATHLRDMQS
ncbi:MAG: VOC family protein [Candidatus Acidiferrales bacterium]